MSRNSTETDGELMMEIGQRLRALRRRRRMTIDEAAQQADLARMTVSRAERGHNPTMLTLLRLLRVYGNLDSLDLFIPEIEISPVELVMESKTRGWLK